MLNFSTLVSTLFKLTDGGTIIGGNIIGFLQVQNSTFDGVTLGKVGDIFSANADPLRPLPGDNTITDKNGLTFTTANDSIVVGDALNYGILDFYGTQTLSGPGSITFDGSIGDSVEILGGIAADPTHGIVGNVVILT